MKTTATGAGRSLSATRVRLSEKDSALPISWNPLRVNPTTCLWRAIFPGLAAPAEGIATRVVGECQLQRSGWTPITLDPHTPDPDVVATCPK
jgi:hypothetical protein